jgi:hypothetical protein
MRAWQRENLAARHAQKTEPHPPCIDIVDFEWFTGYVTLIGL